MEKEVSRRAQIEKNESSSVAHMNPTPLDSIYIRTKLACFLIRIWWASDLRGNSP